MKNYYLKNELGNTIILKQYCVVYDKKYLLSFNGQVNKSMTYNSIGDKERECNYQNDQKHGREIFYYTNGWIAFEQIYKNGKFIECIF